VTVPNGASPEQLNRMLWHGDTISAAGAAECLALRASQPSGDIEDWRVTVYDKMWRPIGPVGGFIECSGADPRNNLPNAQLKIKGDDPLIPVFEECERTMVGVTIETEGLRFAFYVDTFDKVFEKGAWTCTANLVGIWDILNYMQVWPDWWLPIQAQIFSHAIIFSPIVSGIECMVMQQAIRIQSGLWEFVNNALSLNLDIRAWFGSLLEHHGNIYDMLCCPLVVALHNPFLDTSMLVVRTIRMESCGAVIKDITRSTGIDVRIDLWLPGDPQPPNVWITLVQPTYVMTVTDRSQITGPTQTVLDSILKTAVDLAGSMLGDILSPLIQGSQEVAGLPQGFWISPALGINWVPPWVLMIAPESGEPGSVETCRITYHTPKGWQHIIGGRSPQWLNDLMNIFFRWAIDAISILVGFTGIPNDMLAGFLNNAFLAFQLWESYSRRNQVGPYHPAIEVFHATASAPYNVETIFAFINSFWDSRGWVCVQATCRNGQTYKLGKDIFRGQLITVAYNNRTKLYTDFLDQVSWRIDKDTRDLMLQIGDGKAIESPLAKHQRNITGLLEMWNVLTLAPQSG
jgi:hypothetical protein